MKVVVNCIISNPHDACTLLFVRTKKYNDLSLPGTYVPEGANGRDLLVKSVTERTGITIECFKRNIYETVFKINNDEFKRVVYVSDSHSGTPTTRGDMTKYGIEIFPPDLIFNKDWTPKKDKRFAPGVLEVLLKYYADVDGLAVKYPKHTPLKGLDIAKHVQAIR